MKTKKLAEEILALTEEETALLNENLKGGNIQIVPNDLHNCPTGYVWDSVLKKCVFDG